MADVDIFVGAPFLHHGFVDRELRAALHAQAPTLRDVEVFLITARTPILTGALRADVTGDVDPDPDSDELVHLYTGTTNQLDEYGRLYATYQEGGLLGDPTYTNAPHEMFFKVTTDDIPTIEAWALAVVSAALARMVLP